MKTNVVEELSKRLQDKEYIGEAGGGMVRVYLRADLYVTKVEIDYKAIQTRTINEDLTFMSDLFQAAMNAAITNANRDLMSLSQDLMGKVQVI